MPGTQRISADTRLGAGTVVGRQVTGQRAGLQRNGGQRRAQLVRHLIGQTALTLQRGTLLVHQAVDGAHNRVEFAHRMACGQPLRPPHVQLRHIVGQHIQRPQAAPDGQPQRQRHHGQQPHAGLNQLPGNVFGQVITLLQVQQHHHLTFVGRVPLRKTAPSGLGRAQLQVGKTFGRVKRRRIRRTTAADQAAIGVPQRHAERLLVVVAFQARHIHARCRTAGRDKLHRAQAQQHRRHAGQVAVGEFVRLFNAGAVTHHHKTEPDHQQSPQRPKQQTAGEGRASR